MLEEKIRAQQKADEDSLPESIINKSYSNFAILVARSYYPRFIQPSTVKERLPSKESAVSRKSKREPQISEAPFTKNVYEKALRKVSQPSLIAEIAEQAGSYNFLNYSDEDIYTTEDGEGID